VKVGDLVDIYYENAWGKRVDVPGMIVEKQNSECTVLIEGVLSIWDVETLNHMKDWKADAVQTHATVCST